MTSTVILLKLIAEILVLGFLVVCAVVTVAVLLRTPEGNDLPTKRKTDTPKP